MFFPFTKCLLPRSTRATIAHDTARKGNHKLLNEIVQGRTQIHSHGVLLCFSSCFLGIEPRQGINNTFESEIVSGIILNEC